MSIGLAMLVAAGRVTGADALQQLRNAPETSQTESIDLARFVNPFIGTAPSNSPHPVPGGAGGSTIPGAMAPFGMVQMSPDTPKGSPSGYAYQDSVIEQFSMTHFNGAGCPNKEDLPFLPITGSLEASPGTNWLSYGSMFSHDQETASPGFYSVTLDRYGVEVRLAATPRTGIARFAFTNSAEPRVLLNASRNATGTRAGKVLLRDGNEIEVTTIGGGFCGGQTYPIYFVAQFDQPFASSGTWLGDTISAGSSEVSGDSAGGWVAFEPGAVVLMKVGMSYVGMENARANLEAENPGWDIDQVARETRAAWNEVLHRVVIDPLGTDDSGKMASAGADLPSEELTKFYTALYHVFSNPNVFSDVNGQYRGFDDAVHHAESYINYQNWSGWDIYRSWVQLAAMIAPETRDFMHSMVSAGVEGGLLPKWSDGNKEDNVMVGDPGAVTVASAHAFGVRDFDAKTALRLMERSASDPAVMMQGQTIRFGLEGWKRDHYCSGDASITLEYAQADFAVAQFALALGDTALHRTLSRSAQNWQNNWNPESQNIHPRNDSGWLEPFDTARGTGFIEGNAAQYTWMVPFNLRGLFDRMGGDAVAIARLDTLFTELNAGTDRPYFYIGNEPQFATPWAYTFAGAPWKSQEVVRRIVNESFTAAPGGLPGNDDLGATSSWFVWAALGMYPAVPGTDILVLHGPRFPSARVALANGNTLEIRGRNAGPSSPYVQSVAVDGVPLDRSWMHFREIADGGTIEFVMGAEPNPQWGSREEARPPSFQEEAEPAPPPISVATGELPPGKNVGLNKPATASGSCGSSEGPEKAVNGSMTGGNSDKWCSLGPDHWLQVDLGRVIPVTGFVLHHAGAGWESTEWNTKDFDILTSADGATWSTAVSARNNTASVTTHVLPPREARYVKLNVLTPEGCCGTGATRIYELEIYSTE